MNDNSIWKKCKVHALPTNRSEIGYRNGFYITRFGEPFEESCGNANPHHLYITSDEEIKEGDWAMKNGKHLWFIDHLDYKELLLLFPKDNIQKIVATTDPKLINQSDWKGMYKSDECSIAQPSQDFIKKYCEVGGIDEVMVEYETYCNHGDNCPSKGAYDKQHLCDVQKRLKVSPNNTITIRKVKDSWSREEVVNLITDAYEEGYNFGQNSIDWNGGKHVTKWIEENL